MITIKIKSKIKNPAGSHQRGVEVFPILNFQLSFAVLEAFARAGLAVLLALAHARIAGQQALGPQNRPEIGIQGEQSARDAVADSAGLTVESAAVDRDLRVIFVRHTGRCQRLSGCGAHGFYREIVFEGPAVDNDLAGAAGKANAGDGGLAAACAGVLGNFWLRDLNICHWALNR